MTISSKGPWRAKEILVIDGQGGRIGAQLVRGIKERLGDAQVTAVGTNAAATAAMVKAGADAAATGENPVLVACRTAELIVGPVGIVIADSLLGEVTPAMAVAVGQSSAVKVLLPVNRCNNIIVGVSEAALGEVLEDALELIAGKRAEG